MTNDPKKGSVILAKAEEGGLSLDSVTIGGKSNENEAYLYKNYQP